jgi:hypothetical protein
MKYIALILCAALQACGGAGAQSVSAPSVTSGDALSKSFTVTRDASSASGGADGFVNAGVYFRSVAGVFETALEWTQLSVLDNYANQSSGNVAVYAQANKHGTGATFAGVSEASDTTGLGGSLVSHEFDSWVTGKDNGLRIGLEIVNGDSLAIRGLGRSAVAESTTAIRIGQTVSTPHASWGNGIVLTGNIRDSAIKIVNPEGVVVFEVKPNGDVYTNGRKL